MGFHLHMSGIVTCTSWKSPAPSAQGLVLQLVRTHPNLAPEGQHTVGEGVLIRVKEGTTGASLPKLLNVKCTGFIDNYSVCEPLRNLLGRLFPEVIGVMMLDLG